MITKEEHDIVSKYLISQIDFDRVYDDAAKSSKLTFTKKQILDSIKTMIRYYPNFDTSVEDRVESFTLVFTVRKGTFNDYMYFVSGKNHLDDSWWLTEKKFKSRIKFFKYAAMNYVCFNMKECLRGHKLENLIDNVK